MTNMNFITTTRFHKWLFFIFSSAFIFPILTINAQLNTGESNRTPYTIGPGGGGRLIYPAINPWNDNNIMLSVDMATSFISTNGGEWFKELEFTGLARFSFNPHNKDIVYAHTSYIYVSYDGGKTFDFLYPSKDNFRYSATNPNGVYSRFNDMVYDLINTDLKPPHTVLSVAVHPSKENMMFFLTAGGESPEIYKSVNNGKSWNLFAKLPGGAIRAGTASETSSGRFDAYGKMVALTNGGLIVAASTGIFIISPRGEVSIRSNKKSKDGDIVYNPATSQATFYLLESITDDPQFSDRIIKSGNGIEWTPISFSFTDRIATPKNSGKRRFDFIAVSNDHTVYVAYGSSAWDNIGLAKTTNGGDTWEIILRSGSIPANITNVGAMDKYSGFLGWTGMGQGLAVSKTNANLLIATNMCEAYFTKDGGANWDALSNKDNGDGTYTTRGIDPAGPFGIIFDPHNKNHALMPYADIGLWESFDAGKSWSKNNAGSSVAYEWSNTCAQAAFDPDIEGFIITAWNGDHSSRSYADWILYGIRTRPIWFNTGGQITISRDGGKTWSASGQYPGDGHGFDESINENGLPTHQNDRRNSGLPTHCIATDIYIDRNSPKNIDERHIYVTCVGYGIYRSVDGGKSFMPFNKGMNELFLVPFLFAARPDGSELYVTFHPQGEEYTSNPATFAGAIYYINLQNPELGWTKVPVPEGISNQEPGMRIAIDMSVDQNGILYCAGRASSAQNWSRAQFSGVWLTPDHGATWKNIFPPEITTRSIHVDTRNPNLIYAGTNRSEIWVSNKGINTTFADWIEIKGIEHPKTNSVNEDPNDPTWFYAGTVCGGMWRMPLPQSILNPVEDPTSISPLLTKISIFPNPAADILYIENTFRPHKITVFDTSGRIVWNGKDNLQEKMSINISSWAKGIYIISIWGEGNQATSKIIKI